MKYSDLILLRHELLLNGNGLQKFIIETMIEKRKISMSDFRKVALQNSFEGEDFLEEMTRLFDARVITSDVDGIRFAKPDDFR